jgi:hypothetical protein
MWYTYQGFVVTLSFAPETAVHTRAEMLTLDAAGFPKVDCKRLVSAADEDDYVQTIS